MNTVLEVLQSDIYLKATPEQQQLFLQDNGIDNNYLASVGLSAPKEAGIFKKLGRAATRGVASAIENVASIPLRGNIFEGEEESAIDPLAIKIRDYASSYLDSNPSLTKPSDNYLTRITTSAIESTPTSLGYALPNLVALGLDSTVIAAAAGLGISAATFQGMKNATAVTNFINQYKELTDKGLPVDVDKLKAISLKQGTSEGATEIGSDVVSGIALRMLRMLPGGAVAKEGTDLLRNIFKPAGTTVAKQFGKALAISQVGEQAGEITNLFYQEGQREELGLDNRAKEQLAETIGTTALLGGGIMTAGAAVTAPMHRARLNTIKDILFGGIEDASTLDPKQQEEYIQKRLKAASDLVPIIEEKMGEEAARNFMLNVVAATKAAVDPTIESKGSLPFNGSIFTPELDFSNTISVGQTQDINPIDAVQKSVFSKRKGAENFIKQNIDAVSDTDALSGVVPTPAPSATAIPTDFSYATLGALQTQPTTMPVGTDEIVVPDNRDKFIPQQPVHTNQKSVGTDPVVTAQESRQLLQENLKALDLKLRNPLYVEKLSDGELVELRAADLTNLFSKKAIANVYSEFDKRQQAQLDAQQVSEEPVLEQSNTVTTSIEEKPLVEAPSASNVPIVEQEEASIPVETKTPPLKRKSTKPAPNKLVKLDRVETEATSYHAVGEDITGKATLPKVKDIEKEIDAKKAEVKRLETSLQDKYASTKKKEDLEVRRNALLTEIDNLELDLEDAQAEVQKRNEEIDKESKAKRESKVSGDKTPNKVLEALIEDKATVNFILEHISNTATNKLVAKIAKILQRLSPKVDVNVIEDLKDANGNPVMGLYSANTITLNKDYFGKYDMSGVFVHELIHYLVSDKLNRKAYSVFRTRLEALKEQVRTALEKKGMNPEDFYGLQMTSDIDEFLAEAMSDSSLQKVLESIKIQDRSSGVKTLFDKFVNIIRDVLGLDPSNHTVLKEVLSIGLELTQQEKIDGKALIDSSKPLLKEAIRSSRISEAVREAIRGGVREDVQNTKEQAKQLDKSEQALKDAQQRESSRIVHRMISGVFDLKNVAVDNLVIPFIRGEHGNYVYKKLLELYNNRQNNYSNFVFNAMIDEDGRPVFEEAQEAYRDLNDEQRAARTHLLYVGDARKEEYTTLEEANAALKEQAEKKSEYAAVIDQQTFEAYLKARAAINNAFKSQSAQLFSYLANTVFSKYGDDVVVAATKALVKSGKKDASGKAFGKDARIAYLRDYLTTNGFDSKVIPKIIEDFKSTMVQNMKLIKYSLGGGLTGAVPRVRPAKADNPFVFHLYRNHTNKAGEVHKQKVYAKFFPTQGELDAFVKKVNSPGFDLKEIFPFGTVGDIAEYRDTATNQLMYTAEKDTNAEVSDLFRVSPQDRKLTQALITNVLSRLSDSSSISKEEQELIQKEIYKEYTKKIIANSIPRYLARSKTYIGGFDVVDPLSSMIDSLSSIASYVATNDYINQTMQVINRAKGDTKLQLTREFKNSLTQVHEAVRTINNVVSGTFLMLKTVTALSQLHQYASFGLPLMVKQGIPVTRAARLLLASYLKIVMHRFQMETGNLRRGISGDSPFAKHMRKAPMYGVLVQAAKDIEKDMKAKNGQLFSKDELAMLMEHRINNDTYEGITKEYNTVENSIKDNMSSFANTYVVKPGMWFFNQMEISNREASLLAMYRYQRDTLKKTHEDANKEATKFMLRVNSDFSKVNKIGLLRKYPNFSMLFQLTSFFFHAAGMIGLSAIDAGKAVSKGKFTDPSVKAMFVMMGVFVALGGVKGSPFVEFFNKLLSIMFGEDFLLSIEKDIEEFIVDKTDPLSVERYISKKIADMLMRGAPAVVNLDWSANVALRPPFLDAFIDQAYSSKAPTGLVAGAGPNWLTQFFKSLGYVGEGEFWRALATAPLGGFSDIGKAVIYSKEGYGSAKGGVSYIGTEQRKLTKGQAVVKSLGLKTTDMAKTQDIINAEYTVVKGHWERKRSNVITDYIKKVSPYILNKEPIPEKVAKDAIESIQKFNNSWMKADKDIRTTVKPIDSETISSSIKARLFPKKKSLIYQIQQTDILNKE